MRVFLFVLGLLLWAFAVLSFAAAPAVTQEIASIEIGIAGCVLVGAAAIVEAVDKVRMALERANPKAASPAQEFHG